MPSTLALPVRGGRYRVTRVSDSLVIVHDVPVFGELAPGERSNREHVGAAWHMAALADHELDIAGEYLPPLHVGHHDDNTTVERAGHYRITRVGQMRYRGQMRSAMYSDLYVTPAIAERIDRGELTYCSVELGPRWDRPEIFSIALLDHEPPQFKFPLITLADAEAPGDRHFRRQGRGQVVTFSYQEDAVADDKDKKDDKGEAGDDKKMSGDAAPAAPPAAPQPTMADLLKAIQEGFASMRPAPAAAAPAMAAPAAPAAPGDLPPRVDVGHMSRGGGAPAGQPDQLAEMRAKVAALESREAARKQSEQFAADTATAERELEAAGFSLTDDVRKTLRDAATGNHLKQTVEVFKKYALPDPPQSLDGPGHGAVGGSMPRELERFSRLGANELEYGRNLFACWRGAVQRGSKLTWDQYLKAEGVELPA